MSNKSKWFHWTGVFGAIAVAISQYWSYINILQYRKYETSVMHIDAWPPWYISLSFWIGGATLLFSIIAMSEAKWLRKTAIPVAAIMAISGACLILFRQVDGVADPASLIIFITYCALFFAAIASITIIIASWLKRRNKKLPTN